MSWRDRPYNFDDEPSGGPQVRLQFRRPSSMVMWMIIINVAIFFFDVLSQNFIGDALHRFFGLSLRGVTHLYLWQPVTYMFFHGNILHILVNMLMLYVCGSEFERAFGPSRFLQFYAICGVVGGLAYLVLGLVDPGYRPIPLIGASGAGYGLLMAAVVFFPHIQVILFIIPMPIRVFGLIVAAMLVFKLISPAGVDNLGGEVCHVAGAATALLVFKFWGLMPRFTFGRGGAGAGAGGFGATGGFGAGGFGAGGFGGDEAPSGSLMQRLFPGWAERRRKRQAGAWQRRQQQQAREAAEVDRILAKVHREGLQSLTRREKRILSRASRRQQQQERHVGRTDRL